MYSDFYLLLGILFIFWTVTGTVAAVLLLWSRNWYFEWKSSLRKAVRFFIIVLVVTSGILLTDFVVDVTGLVILRVVSIILFLIPAIVVWIFQRQQNTTSSKSKHRLNDSLFVSIRRKKVQQISLRNFPWIPRLSCIE